MQFFPTLDFASDKLYKFIKSGLDDYHAKRNFDLGINNKTNVSCLSPYLRKRILHEKLILNSCLKDRELKQIEKFVQEVFWRTYWKGWLEGRKTVWKDYVARLKNLKSEKQFKLLKKDYNKAINGQTGINCFDAWVTELLQTGYLHNHARMWFASIWIFTLRLPWELGANFFYDHLLDADPASNTLSWRWVTGLQTQGKIYLATENNIEKFSTYNFKRGFPLAKKAAIPDYEYHKYEELNFVEKKPKKGSKFLINLNNLIYSHEQIELLNKLQVFYLAEENNASTGVKKKEFNKLALNKYLEYLTINGITVKILNNTEELKNNCLEDKEIFCNYPSVGYELDRLKKISLENSLQINYIYDKYDMLCWPFAKAGFFKFKSQIPYFIKQIEN